MLHRLTSPALAAACVLVSVIAQASEPPAEPLTFEQHIRPILRAHCLDCHGAVEEKEGGLDLRLVRFQQSGGDSGPALVAGSPDESLLLQRIRSGEMPPGESKVTPAEIATIERWIAAGAPTARPEPETIGPGLGVSPEERAWWAFQPIARPQIPSHPDWQDVRTPIDALLRQSMPEGLTFSGDADKLTLLRRVAFDLTGLPPTDEQVARFMADESPQAYERLIDELLDSPHYGERWARHWLDIAGYSDSEGATSADAPRQWAYKYRDYVIRSFNADKPLDRFIIEQLAGDELAGPVAGDLTPEQIELLTATGFLRMAADGTGSGDNSPEARNQVVADTLKIVGTSLLGLSVACAQCHDHRYDPIPHTDYFALRAVFEPALDWQNWKTPPERQVSLYTEADRAAAAAVEAEAQEIAKERQAKQDEYMAAAVEMELAKFEEPLREQLRSAYTTPADQRTDEQKQLLDQHPSVNISPGVLYQYNQSAADDLKKYDERIAAVRAKRPVEEFLRILQEPPGHAPETKLFYRGDYRQPLQTVAPAALAVLTPENERVEFTSTATELPTTGRRRAFAQWLTSRDNPLTPRVIANRVWMHHFGKGLVATPADFGRLGTPPTHPELLDWLADELITQGWSLKSLHRQIMLSTAYRQSSRRDPERNAIDPENHYYSRKDIIRLDAETLTDRMLAAAGQLDLTLFGPPVPVKEDETGQVVVDGEQRRRSLYLTQRRSQPVALLQAFDAPVMQTNCEVRPSSTVATQSLMLMNGDFVLQRAAQLATRSSTADPASLPEGLNIDAAPLTAEVTALWQFGYGSYNAESQRTGAFTLLPHWTGSAWQGGPELPDPNLGWVMQRATGGHTGANPDFAPIRRWTSPVNGVVRITGTLQHGSPNGDGVRGRIVGSSSGLAGEWTALNGEVTTFVETLNVAQGDTIDFITDCVGDVNSDSFNWSVTIQLMNGGTPVANWQSGSGFHGPVAAGTPLHPAHVVAAWRAAYRRDPQQDELLAAFDFLRTQLATMQTHPESLAAGVTPEQQALTNLCQALLTSNEFLYVD